MRRRCPCRSATQQSRRGRSRPSLSRRCRSTFATPPAPSSRRVACLSWCRSARASITPARREWSELGGQRDGRPALPLRPAACPVVYPADARGQAQGPVALAARPLAHGPRIRRVDQPRRAGVRRAPRVRRERRDLVRTRAGHRPAVGRRACLRRLGRVRVGQPGLSRAERRCVVTAPWCDCPPCASCGTEVGIPTTSDGSPLPPPWLWCPACGHRWEASAEDRARADRAQAAWDRHQDEEKAGAL